MPHPSHPDPQDWLDGSGRRLESQTDKEKFKIVPCTAEGCDVDIVVNTFYAPAKAKCSEHSGNTASGIAATRLVHDSGDAKPNGAIAKLLCPFCENPLEIISIAPNGSQITYRCLGGTKGKSLELLGAEPGPYCGASIIVRPNFGALEMKHYPTELAAQIEEFNLTARVRYFDMREHASAKKGA